MVILGIDPGLNRLGYGIIKKENSNLIHISHGCITSSAKETMSDRIKHIYIELEKIIEKFKPNSISLEKVFVKINPNTALKLGYVRGLLYLLSSQNHIPLAEYSAKEVKKGITGYGQAEKEQVMMMVKNLLNISDIKYLDESDALGLAIYHANIEGFTQRISS
ncbi:MAG: crossover junction endodeoxyribonuclease RuvC [Pseudomonadota bacterium]